VCGRFRPRWIDFIGAWRHPVQASNQPGSIIMPSRGAIPPESLTLGDISCTWTGEPFTFALSQYRVGERLDLHEHAAAYVCINLGPAFGESGPDGRVDAVDTDNVVAHPAGDLHANCFGPGGGLCLSLFPGPRPNAAWMRALSGKAVARSHELLRLASALRREIHGASGHPQSEAFAFTEIAYEIVDGLNASPVSAALNRRGVLRALEAVRDAPAQHWSLDGLASLANLHPTHLARQVQRETGRTLGEHLRARRLLAAMEQLRVRDAVIADVATDCGFADQAHLTRIMRRMMGTTPARFLRRAGATRR
jgi:AraC family transcriptional regulator